MSFPQCGKAQSKSLDSKRLDILSQTEARMSLRHRVLVARLLAQSLRSQTLKGGKRVAFRGDLKLSQKAIYFMSCRAYIV